MSVGMMNQGYFAGRSELLGWMNDLLQLDYKKVEQVSNGAALCQILDAAHPGTVSMSKVNYAAKTDYESIKNYKVLQAAMSKLNIDRHVDVPRLLKGRPLDSIEILQWAKAYYDRHATGEEYDALARRKGQQASSRPAPGAAAPAAKAPAKKAAPAAAAPARVPAKKAAPAAAAAAAKSPAVSSASTSTTKGATPASKASAASTARVKELEESIAELKLTVHGLEREREFYYSKLLKVEGLAQENEHGQISADTVLGILYATDDDEAALGDEGADAIPDAGVDLVDDIGEDKENQPAEEIEA